MIEIINVSKRYKKYTVPYNSLKSFLLNHKRYVEESKRIDELCAVNHLNMNIYPGEIVCIVGRNGAGKSTLAKMIAGTTEPTEGVIKIKGRIIPFLELGVAFNSELSGRDNVIMNGVLLGLKKHYIETIMQDIFDFAEVSDFIETPLKFYSSGMLMRLAFSIGMHADGDIYIFDEILAVGDANFQKKCFSCFENLIKSGKTILLITHDLGIVSRYATRVLLLNGETHRIIESSQKIKNIANKTIDELYEEQELA